MRFVLLAFALLAGAAEAQPFYPVIANRISVGTGAPAAGLCTSSSDVGKIYARKDGAAFNSTFYLCANTAASTYTWELHGGVGGEGSIVLANGVNDNINIGNSGLVVISGPTAAFSLGGFTGGTPGRVLWFWNTDGQQMTIVNASAGSSTGNKIFTNTGANVTLRAGNSFAVFIWSGLFNEWVLAASN